MAVSLWSINGGIVYVPAEGFCYAEACPCGTPICWPACAFTGVSPYDPVNALCIPDGKVWKLTIGNLGLVNHWCACCDQLTGPFYLYVPPLPASQCYACCLRHICSVPLDPFMARALGFADGIAYTHTFLRVWLTVGPGTNVGDPSAINAGFEELYGFSANSTPGDVQSCLDQPGSHGVTGDPLPLLWPFPFRLTVHPGAYYQFDLDAETPGYMAGPYTLDKTFDNLGYYDSYNGLRQTCEYAGAGGTMPATLTAELVDVTDPPTEDCGTPTEDCGVSVPPTPDDPADCAPCAEDPASSIAVTLSGYSDGCCSELNDTFILDAVPSTPCCLLYVGDLPACTGQVVAVDQLYLSICYDPDSNTTTINQGFLYLGNASLFSGWSGTTTGRVDCADIASILSLLAPDGLTPVCDEFGALVP